MTNQLRSISGISASLLVSIALTGCAEMARKQAEFRQQCEASGKVVYYQPGWGNVCITAQEAAARQAAAQAADERRKDREAYLAGECMKSGRTWVNGACLDFRGTPLGSSPNVGSDSGRWDSATKFDEGTTGDSSIRRCFYQTLGGYRFSVDVRGMCPYQVEVNVETGRVRQR